jgi:hypothetical protein
MNVELMVSQEVFGQYADGKASQPRWPRMSCAPGVDVTPIFHGPWEKLSAHHGMR